MHDTDRHRRIAHANPERCGSCGGRQVQDRAGAPVGRPERLPLLRYQEVTAEYVDLDQEIAPMITGLLSG